MPRPREEQIEGSREKGCRSLADGLLRETEREREEERQYRGDGWTEKAEKGGKTETQRKTVLCVTRGKKISD